jgi:hypothetical protein
MHGPDGKTYPNESVFEAVVPDDEIVLRHVCLPYFRLAIALEERPGGTLLTWEQAFEDDQAANAMRGFLETANEQNLDRLCAEVQSGASPAS